MKVAGVDNACHGKHNDGQHGHGVGTNAGDLVEHPQGNGDNERHGYNHGAPVVLQLTADGEVNGLLCEGEELLEQHPADEEQDDGERHHESHPLAEAEVEVQTVGVVKIFKGDGVWRGSDGGSHTANVGCYRDGEREGYAALSVGRQRAEHRCEEREHHGCGGGVADEHREHACYEDEA